MTEHHELLVSRLKRCLIKRKAGCQIKGLKIVGHVTSQTHIQSVLDSEALTAATFACDVGILELQSLVQTLFRKIDNSAIEVD